MSTFQKVIICGNLGDDPHIHQFEGGGLMAQLSIATTEHWRDKNSNEKMSRTEWHRVIANGKSAETIEKYCKKGDKLLIEGKIRTRKWNDKSGIERYSTEIICERFVFMSSKNNSNENKSNTSTAQSQKQNPENAGNDFLNIPEGGDDDLPF